MNQLISPICPSLLPIWYTANMINGQLQILKSQSIQIDPPSNPDPDPDPDDDSALVGPQGPQGEQGPPGPQGPQGEQGPQGIPGECCQNAILVQEDYVMTSSDYYVGVRSDGPTTITLPAEIKNNRTFIIKAEMGPPVGNRKVTIKTSDGSFIDGQTSIIMQTPYECVQLVYRGSWNIVSHV